MRNFNRKKLLRHKGIESVDASLKNNIVDINYVGKNGVDITKLNTEFKQLGYKFSATKFKALKTKPLFSFHNGNLEINAKKLRDAYKTLLVVFIFIGAFFLFENFQLGRYVSVDSNSSIPAFFALGLIAGLSSCAALIGGLLLSLVKQWNEVYIAESNIQKAQPHIMFHAGRIISFFILGGALGLIGKSISLSNTTFISILTILVSFIMFTLALQMLGVGWAQKFKFTAPKFFTRYIADESNFEGKYMPSITGALTFFLPCGFTLIAQSVALTSGNVLQGALIMLAFSLGTLPTLLAISFGGLAFNARPHLTARFNIVAGLIIIFFVIYNVNGQLNVLGYPSLNDISFSSSNKETQEIAEVNNGVQVINLVTKGFEYIPTGSTTIKANIPTKLIIDNQGTQGCAAYMASRGLIKNYIEIKPGITEVDLGSPRKGTYKITCAMGMVAPVTINVVN